MAFVDASYILEVKAKERPDLPGLGTDPIFTHQITGLVGTLTSTSPVPATKVFSGQVTLSGGALEFQLDTLTDLEGDALTLTGLKVQLAFFRNQGGNAVIDIEDGPPNPYFLFSTPPAKRCLSWRDKQFCCLAMRPALMLAVGPLTSSSPEPAARRLMSL